MERQPEFRPRGYHPTAQVRQPIIKHAIPEVDPSQLSSLGLLTQEAKYKTFYCYHLIFGQTLSDKKPLSSYLLECFTVRKLVFLPVDPMQKNVFGSAVLIHEGAPRTELELETHRNIYIAGVQLQSRQITLAEAGELVDQKRTKLYVGNIPYPSEQHDLWNYFSQFGELESASLVKRPTAQNMKGFGYIVYRRRESMEYVLTLKHYMLQQKLNVKVFMNKGRLKKQDGNQLEAIQWRPDAHKHVYKSPQIRNDQRECSSNMSHSQCPELGYDYFHCESDCEEHQIGHRIDDQANQECKLETASLSTAQTQNSTTCAEFSNKMTGGLSCCFSAEDIKREVDPKEKDQFAISSFFKSKFHDHLPFGFESLSVAEFANMFKCKCPGCPCKTKIGPNAICLGSLLKSQTKEVSSKSCCGSKKLE